MKGSFLAQLLLAVSMATGGALGATKDQWKTRSIYQILTDRFATTGTPGACPSGTRTYCGGTFQGIISKLDYIQGLGFDAIWISPVVKNIGDESFHGYWAQDLYSINDKYGTAADLKALSAELHRRGMYLMVDVVANHMGPQSSGAVGTQAYVNAYKPFNKISDYHNFCTITNYNDQNNVEQCWLGTSPTDGLPDLNTEDPNVVNTLNSWVKGLVSNYTIDGLRVDTVKHVRRDFWPAFNAASGVFNVGEILSGNPAFVKDYQNYMDGVLNFPIFYPLTRAFQKTGQGFTELKNMVDTVRSYKDPAALGVFSENHDLPRFPSLNPDVSLAQNMITFVLASDYIPIVYYGQEQGFSGGNDPYNREALWTSGYSTTTPQYKMIAAINKLRKVIQSKGDTALATPLTSLYDDAAAWAYNKGKLLVVLSSAGSNGGTQTVNIGASSLPAGGMTDVVQCKSITVGNGGSVQVQLTGGKPAVFYPTASLTGSGLCGK